MTSRSDATPREWDDAEKNTPERMLKRGGRLLRTSDNRVLRLKPGEREYLEWVVSERARRAS